MRVSRCCVALGLPCEGVPGGCLLVGQRSVYNTLLRSFCGVICVLPEGIRQQAEPSWNRVAVSIEVRDAY